jgi:hypothetical protein
MGTPDWSTDLYPGGTQFESSRRDYVLRVREFRDSALK